MARRPPIPPAQKPVKTDNTPKAFPFTRFFLWLFRPLIKAAFILVIVSSSLVILFAFVNPPLTYLMASEYFRLGKVTYEWADLADMSTNIPLAMAAAEDANFCDHNGFDFDAIEAALGDGRGRGASTISQQVAKNLFLWPGRNWLRKGLEAGFTILIENFWSKRRIMEVYVNIAEFDEGVFGVKAASAVYFRSPIENMHLQYAARLAMVLPNPRERSANSNSSYTQRRSSSIAIGANTLRVEGRADCFLPKTTP